MLFATSACPKQTILRLIERWQVVDALHWQTGWWQAIRFQYWPRPLRLCAWRWTCKQWLRSTVKDIHWICHFLLVPAHSFIRSFMRHHLGHQRMGSGLTGHVHWWEAYAHYSPAPRIRGSWSGPLHSTECTCETRRTYLQRALPVNHIQPILFLQWI